MPTAFIQEIRVKGLFGLYDHRITFRESPVTIVAGPNGVGKTTLLSASRALLQGTYRDVVRHSFERLSVTTDQGDSLVAVPLARDPEADDDVNPLRLQLQRGEEILETSDLAVSLLPNDLVLPHYIELHGRDTYWDARVGEFLSVDDLNGRRVQDLDRAQPSLAWLAHDRDGVALGLAPLDAEREHRLQQHHRPSHLGGDGHSAPPPA